MTNAYRYFKNALIAVFSTTIVTIIVGCSDKLTNDMNSSKTLCNIKTNPFPYSVCQVDSKELLKENSKLSMHLFWRKNGENTNKNIKPFFTFDALNQGLGDEQTLKFATNAGMYNNQFAPIGYTVIDGTQVLSLNLNEGVGNFHLMPNGVFWWDKKGFHITESKEMAKKLNSGAKPLYASQSGPMLVIKGKIHPKFKENSTSKKIRNGVGMCEDGKLKFVNTASLVNFYEFAELFKNDLKCNNALFFDGGIASSLYAPTINRHDKKNMGVIVGLVEK